MAAFQVAGWYDIFLESSLRHWAANQAVERPQRLVIGPWSHSNGLSNLHPEIDFGAGANGVYMGVLGAALHWMRRVLDGAAVEPGISCFVMGEGWRELASWPPPARDLGLHLSTGPIGACGLAGDGALLRRRPTTNGTDEVRHDPADPVRTRGGRGLGPFLPLPGPVDQRLVEGRRDVLVYTSELLDESVPVVGMIRARLAVDSAARSLDVAVKVCDGYPDGRSINVVDSIRRVDVVAGQLIGALGKGPTLGSLAFGCSYAACTHAGLWAPVERPVDDEVSALRSRVAEPPSASGQDLLSRARGIPGLAVPAVTGKSPCGHGQESVRSRAGPPAVTGKGLCGHGQEHMFTRAARDRARSGPDVVNPDIMCSVREPTRSRPQTAPDLNCGYKFGTRAGHISPPPRCAIPRGHRNDYGRGCPAAASPGETDDQPLRFRRLSTPRPPADVQARGWPRR